MKQSTSTRLEMAQLLKGGMITTPKEYFDMLMNLMTVDEWFARGFISEDEALAYPNAKTAALIKASPLGKALE